MKMIDLIEKKKRGGILTKEEIGFWIDGYVKGEIPDYQVSALLMAILLNGMTEEETFDLTTAMKYSGDVLDLSPFGQTIDKHSTGGIGDKLSLIVMPLWRAGGLTIAKMSGRGLGFTGGTVDKLESVPGYDTALDKTAFFEHVKEYGIVVTGQSASLVPADKKLYALRDVTATVDSLPLIAASIMSKKLATAASNIVLDVKFGEGTFMKTKEDARKLAELMVRLGKADGRAMAALLSPMDQPLGRAVGNALEVREAFEFLCGKYEGILAENAFALAGVGFVIGGKAETLADGIALCRELIASDKAKEAFFLWLKSQGGTFREKDFLKAIAYPAHVFEVRAENDGIVKEVKALAIGTAGMEMGAGRKKLDDVIDPAAGVLLKKTCGEAVRKDDVLAVLYGRERSEAAEALVRDGIVIGEAEDGTANSGIEIFIDDRWELLEIKDEI
ncbi:MAG: thymidine phosphorylase [Firmicutes bacterium]|nr:thymidine phosphorylase [Bacillota bacterium]